VLRDYLRELGRAARRGLDQTDSYAVLVAILLGVVSYWVPSIQPVAAHLPWWILAWLLLSFVIIRLFTTPYRIYVDHRKKIEGLEHRLTPRLNVRPPDIANTQTTAGKAVYVRVPVYNDSEGAALGCTARLLKIEHLGKNGWRDLGYTDTLAIGWSNKSGSETRELAIHPGTAELLDLVYGIPHSRNLYLATIVQPNAYKSLMHLPGHYQFTLQITSANDGPRTAQVRIHWGYNDTIGLPDDPVSQVQ
jgi:hypothetical protein